MDVCVTGACCSPLTGECVETLAFGCEELGGVFQGPGTDCDPNLCPPPVGACCIDGSCVPDQSEADCAGAGGQWAGALTECDADLCVLGACCVGDICVPDQSEANCLSVTGAQWAGLFTHCFAGLCPICDDGDADEDGNVDLHDFARFQTCFGADGTGDCKCVDMDNDNDVDLTDYARFYEALSGP